MDAFAQHMVAFYALIASVIVPVLIVGVWRWTVKRQQRKAQEAMRRGNQLHRTWLETSKQVIEQTHEN